MTTPYPNQHMGRGQGSSPCQAHPAVSPGADGEQCPTPSPPGSPGTHHDSCSIAPLTPSQSPVRQSRGPRVPTRLPAHRCSPPAVLPAHPGTLPLPTGHGAQTRARARGFAAPAVFPAVPVPVGSARAGLSSRGVKGTPAKCNSAQSFSPASSTRFFSACSCRNIPGAARTDEGACRSGSLPGACCPCSYQAVHISETTTSPVLTGACFLRLADVCIYQI